MAPTWSIHNDVLSAEGEHVLSLPEAWVWDFWLTDDGQHYHLFFLYGSRALRDPDRRHDRASIGHAVSDDLVRWRRVTDALVRSDPPAYDDLATWTGSVVHHPDGTWFLFYTSATMTPHGNRQTISYATSADLMTWTRGPENPVLHADPAFYETLSSRTWHDEAFRDPWVYPDPVGNGWHMLITARSNHGPVDDRGVVGHAWSADLRRWDLRGPLSEPGQGFGQLEVMQVEDIGGHPLLMFSCMANAMSVRRRATGMTGGVWAAPADTMLGPYHLADAVQLTGRDQYSGRMIRRRNSGEWVFLTFAHDKADGSFIGEISDPTPLDEILSRAHVAASLNGRGS